MRYIFLPLELFPRVLTRARCHYPGLLGQRFRKRIGEKSDFDPTSFRKKKKKRKGKRETVERARKRARYYHEQSRTNPGYLLLPGLPLNLPSPLLAGRLPTILYVVHFREADRSLAGRAFSLHDLAVHFCKRGIDRDICFIFCE